MKNLSICMLFLSLSSGNFLFCSEERDVSYLASNLCPKDDYEEVAIAVHDIRVKTNLNTIHSETNSHDIGILDGRVNENSHDIDDLWMANDILHERTMRIVSGLAYKNEEMGEYLAKIRNNFEVADEQVLALSNKNRKRKQEIKKLVNKVDHLEKLVKKNKPFRTQKNTNILRDKIRKNKSN